MFKLAWRNLRRNPRRTAITSAAIGFAVFLITFMLSIEHGTYRYTENYATGIWNGKARIFRKGYFQKETLSRSFKPSPELISLLRGSGLEWCLRITGFGLVSFGDKTYGASITGLQPSREISKIRNKILRGRFLRGRGEAVVGWRLARNLGVSPGERVAVLVQGRDGSLGAKLFDVVGVFRTGVIDLDREKVLISLSDADELFSMGGRVTSVVLYSERDFEEKIGPIEEALGGELEIIPWQKMMPELLEMIDFDRAGAYTMYLILLLVVIFGLLNTMLMAAVERRKEIGVMRAVGIPKGKIGLLLAEESLLTSLAGVVLGEVLSLPLLLYFHSHPIKLGGKMAEVYESFQFAPVMPALLSWEIFAVVGAGVLLLSLFVAIFPVARVLREDLAHQLRFEK